MITKVEMARAAALLQELFNAYEIGSTVFPVEHRRELRDTLFPALLDAAARVEELEREKAVWIKVSKANLARAEAAEAKLAEVS